MVLIHADIFDDLKAINARFHHMIRTIIPASGLVLSSAMNEVQRNAGIGMLVSTTNFRQKDNDGFAEPSITNDASHFAVFHYMEKVAEVKIDHKWDNIICTMH